jgi:hypothetical protein
VSNSRAINKSGHQKSRRKVLSVFLKTLRRLFFDPNTFDPNTS